MDVTGLEIELKRHAVIRAIQRGVSPGMIEATIKGGKIFCHGRNRLKFTRQYKKSRITCVDHVKGDRVVIVTIEVGK